MMSRVKPGYLLSRSEGLILLGFASLYLPLGYNATVQVNMVLSYVVSLACTNGSGHRE